MHICVKYSFYGVIGNWQIYDRLFEYRWLDEFLFKSSILVEVYEPLFQGCFQLFCLNFFQFSFVRNNYRIAYSFLRGLPVLLMFLTDISKFVAVLSFWQPAFTHGHRQKLQQKILNEKVQLLLFLTSEAHSLLKRVRIPPAPPFSIFKLMTKTLEIFFFSCCKRIQL